MNNLNLVLPEIFISLSVMFLLILGVFKKNSSQLTFNLSLVTILVAIILTVNETFSVNRITIFEDSIVIVEVIKIANKEKLKIILELSFLKTPKTSKNIIESEIKISGNTKFKFSILFTSYICVMHIN